MRALRPQVKAFEQPLQFLESQCVSWRCRDGRWPGEAFLLQPLVPQAEAIAVPVQGLDLIAAAVDEHVQSGAERVQSQFLLDQRCQPVDGFAKVDRSAVQIDCVNLAAGMHQRACPVNARHSAASQCGLGNCGKFSCTPVPMHS